MADFIFWGRKISSKTEFLVTIISYDQKLSIGYKIMEIMSTIDKNATIYRGKTVKNTIYLDES